MTPLSRPAFDAVTRLFHRVSGIRLHRLRRFSFIGGAFLGGVLSIPRSFWSRLGRQ